MGESAALAPKISVYEINKALKLRLLQSRATQTKADIKAGNTVDGEAFFNDLESGHHD